MVSQKSRSQQMNLDQNGFVFDPANGINGGVEGYRVQNGKIVEPSKLTTGAKVVDARGRP